jgi:hypothetical protein
MKIIITMDVDDEYADSTHEMGVTSEGYEAIMHALMGIGDDIDVTKAASDE